MHKCQHIDAGQRTLSASYLSYVRFVWRSETWIVDIVARRASPSILICTVCKRTCGARSVIEVGGYLDSWSKCSFRRPWGKHLDRCRGSGCRSSCRRWSGCCAHCTDWGLCRYGRWFRCARCLRIARCRRCCSTRQLWLGGDGCGCGSCSVEVSFSVVVGVRRRSR